jgi:hypothetical protein
MGDIYLSLTILLPVSTVKDFLSNTFFLVGEPIGDFYGDFGKLPKTKQNSSKSNLSKCIFLLTVSIKIFSLHS